MEEKSTRYQYSKEDTLGTFLCKSKNGNVTGNILPTARSNTITLEVWAEGGGRGSTG